jgi:hypothetical protein
LFILGFFFFFRYSLMLFALSCLSSQSSLLIPPAWLRLKQEPPCLTCSLRHSLTNLFHPELALYHNPHSLPLKWLGLEAWATLPGLCLCVL